MDTVYLPVHWTGKTTFGFPPPQPPPGWGNRYDGGGGGEKQRWLPTYVQLSGWSTGGGHISTRATELMQEAEAKQVITFIGTKWSDAARDAFDEEATRTENSNKPFGYGRLRLLFKTGTPSKVLWDLRNQILVLAQTQEFKAVTAKQVRASVEPSPWKRPHNMAAGGAYSAWQGLSQVPIRCELGPPFTFVWCTPDANDPSKNFVIASFGDKSRTWKVDEAQIHTADPNVDAVEFKRRLDAY